MACWECLLSPQCVFTEPNSFLGRNGASLRNMCTTHLLLLLPPSLTHTDTHTLTRTHTPNKPDLWYLGSSAVRWCEEAAASECELSSALPEASGSGEAKNKRPGKSPRGWRQTNTGWMCCSCKTRPAKHTFCFDLEWCSFFCICTIKVWTVSVSIKEERWCSQTVWKLRSNSEPNKESDCTILIHWEMLNYAVSILFKWVSYLGRHLTDMCKMRNKVSVQMEEQHMPLRKVLLLHFFRCMIEMRRASSVTDSAVHLFLCYRMLTLKKNSSVNIFASKKIILKLTLEGVIVHHAVNRRGQNWVKNTQAFASVPFSHLTWSSKQVEMSGCVFSAQSPCLTWWTWCPDACLSVVFSRGGLFRVRDQGTHCPGGVFVPAGSCMCVCPCMCVRLRGGGRRRCELQRMLGDGLPKTEHRGTMDLGHSWHNPNTLGRK